VVELIARLDEALLAKNVAEVRTEIAEAAARVGRDPAGVELLAAIKYVPCSELPKLAAAGIELVGENRARDLEEKAAAHTALFEWDFIGALQSRKVRAIVGRARLIHSLASESALRELARHRDRARPDLGVLVQVNVAGDAAKQGIAPAQLDAFIERVPVPVVGLSTMPPLAGEAERSRPVFARLRELADARGLSRLSMGTTQDFAVAVEEGATIVRIGTRLYGPATGPQPAHNRVERPSAASM
jgi:hypothetical protein